MQQDLIASFRGSGRCYIDEKGRGVVIAWEGHPMPAWYLTAAGSLGRHLHLLQI